MALPYATPAQAKQIAEEILKQGGSTPIPSGLEVIEWDGVRNFTSEEFEKLFNFKAVVRERYDGEFEDYSRYYIPNCSSIDKGDIQNSIIYLIQWTVADDGILPSSVRVLMVYYNGVVDSYEWDWDSALQGVRGVKLYKHEITFVYSSYNAGADVGGLSFPITLILTREEPITLQVSTNIFFVANNGLIFGSSDEGYPIYSFDYIVNQDKIIFNNASNTQKVELTTITNFVDTVTEL